MKLGDLVRGDCHGSLGMVMEEEEYEGEVGVWVQYFDDLHTLRWYSFNERHDVEVISENR
jgi:hypothetical protein